MNYEINYHLITLVSVFIYIFIYSVFVLVVKERNKGEKATFKSEAIFLISNRAYLKQLLFYSLALFAFLELIYIISVNGYF